MFFSRKKKKISATQVEQRHIEKLNELMKSRVDTWDEDLKKLREAAAFSGFSGGSVPLVFRCFCYSLGGWFLNVLDVFGIGSLGFVVVGF